MSIQYGGDKITFPDGSSSASSQVGMKNRVINGGFTINQRVYVSNTALSAGVYAHDRWKAGASGCTYTFTQGSLGVNTSITISSGSLQQVIEGCNMPEGGTYTLSWTGTAQAKIAGGSYAVSPITVTGLTAGANCTIEFGTGTVGSVQVEKGSIPTSFDYRLHDSERALCQRYYQQWGGEVGYTRVCLAQARSTTSADVILPLIVPMRTAPSYSSVGTMALSNSASGFLTIASYTNDSSTSQVLQFLGNVASGLVAGNASQFATNNDLTARFKVSAEL